MSELLEHEDELSVEATSEAEILVDETEVTPVVSPGHETISIEAREGSHSDTGMTARISWGARTDVGLVREHNEDSYLVQAPVFAVCDGMGGHAAGEVASSIAVETIAKQAPLHADDVLLGAAVEAANTAVIEGAISGRGRQGMGCTASCALIEDSRMAIAHVGDSRIYLLRHGTLVRLTHDHSYVEELVDAGEITADEARVHPSRSVITRALGSDPDMYADHFMVEVLEGDRIVLCSDGLSSMVEDSEIEAIAVSSPTPQSAADTLVPAAPTEGGHDNVSVIVVDVLDDGVIDEQHGRIRKAAATIIAILISLTALTGALLAFFINTSWYVGVSGGNVTIYHGIQGSFMGLELSREFKVTSVLASDLPEATQKLLADGVVVESEDAARATIQSYREQIDASKTAAADAADKITSSTDASPDNPVEPQGPDENAPTEGEATGLETTAANSSVSSDNTANKAKTKDGGA